MISETINRRILFINNSLVPGNRVSENFIPHFRSSFDVVNVLTEMVPEEGEGYSHIILSGSGADFDGPWQDRESSLIRWAYEKGLPLLGVCYGHQMIVKTLYGTGCLGPMDKANYGWHSIRSEMDDDIFGIAGKEYSVFSHHFWEVKEVPLSEVEVFASSSRCRIHDYTVSYKLAKEYFDLIDAPKKAFYTFENSAHSPIFEEPGKVREIIFNEVLPE
jgi:GMP synthase-like glutamine amidotransferase